MRIVRSRGGATGSFTPPWLTECKRPGKICRRRQFRRPGAAEASPDLLNLYNAINELGEGKGMARGSHRDRRNAVMGVMRKSPARNLSGEQRMPSVYSARVLQVTGAALLALALSALPAGATSRIKDLANIEGVRQNQLIGYGLVVGLNGTGDTLNNIPFTKQSLQAMLERMGVNIRGATIRTGNVAAVMVTGNLPAFGTQGTRMDVTVSALGDAKNLMGGTLLVTPLLGERGHR